jgi:hypothetical protein
VLQAPFDKVPMGSQERDVAASWCRFWYILEFVAELADDPPNRCPMKAGLPRNVSLFP